MEFGILYCEHCNGEVSAADLIMMQVLWQNLHLRGSVWHELSGAGSLN